MKKKITAFLTAAAMTACMTAQFPASASDVTLSLASYLQNMVNITVTDKNGSPVEDAKLKLMDSNGICRAKFTGNTDSGYAMNNSEIKIVPYDDDKDLIKADIDILKNSVPADHEIVRIDRERYVSSDYPIYLEDGETEDFTVYHCDNNTAADFTLAPGNIAICTDSDYSLKKADGYIKYNGMKYYFKDSLNSNNNIICYPVSELTETTTFGVESTSSGHGGSITGLYPNKNETEYIKCRTHVSEFSDRFNSDGTYTLPGDVNGSGSPITFNIKDDNFTASSAFMVMSGSVISAIIPDSNGYVEFYVEKSSRKYSFHICMDYSFSDEYYYHSTGKSDSGTFYFADTTTVTAAAPDFPETGTSLMYVPAGSYTIEADSLPEQYALSKPVSITVEDSKSIQNVTVVLSDYEQPPQPPEPENGLPLYPLDNIVDVVVWDYEGNLVPDLDMRIKDNIGIVNDRFDSGGTYYKSSVSSPIQWYENGSEKKEMKFPLESFQNAAGIPDAFAMYRNGSYIMNTSNAQYIIGSGQTVEATLFSKEDTSPTVATLDAYTMGIYVDPKWEVNSAFTGYIIVEGKPIYINPSDGSGHYGIVNKYSIDNFTSSVLYGLCTPGTVPTKGSTFTRPSINDEKTEYILYRAKLSELSDKFLDDGTINNNDYIIDPRNNTKNAKALILIVSGSMISAVIPDKDGYVQFLAEKETRRYRLDCCFGYNTNNGSSSGSINTSGMAAEKYTSLFTTPQLPDIGSVLSNVPAGEYTLTFNNLPAKYKDPGKVSSNVVNINGIQTIEITLEKGYRLGNVNENDTIDIGDATLALKEYALTASGLKSCLTDAQKLAADVNEDGIINITDATIILKYYSYCATGGTDSIENYIKNNI